ncbi:MAG: A/G-specific adenine glycosylase [Algoriphagus sp.]|jgi:A/G-specific adenine glycosylase
MLSQKIIEWYQENKRILPWRRTKDPYRIWLSEIIMQQTRVDQGLPYYDSFVTLFPTVYDLAAAEESEVLRTWQGLGYYSRARNLHKTAKRIVDDYNGIFPKSSIDLLELKGIGPYTSAAISSICYDEPKAVVDGNVYRVLSRLYEIGTPINSSAGIKTFAHLAQSLITSYKPGDFNQGMMEIGATVCTPKKPKCHVCPISYTCNALQNNSQLSFPTKLKKAKLKDRYFNYLVIRSQGKIFLKKRELKDIWIGLYEFFLIESMDRVADLDVLKKSLPEWLKDPSITQNPIYTKQILSHQRIYAQFWILDLERIPQLTSYSFYNLTEIDSLPKHRLIEKYLLEYLK